MHHAPVASLLAAANLHHKVLAGVYRHMIKSKAHKREK
jgi:hypothetical protein